MKSLHPYYREIFVWSAALVYLGVIDPFISGYISFCPLHNVGFDFCPGCGLGRSISLFFHGEIQSSLTTHILGIPTVVIVVYRIIQLAYNSTYQSFMHRTL